MSQDKKSFLEISFIYLIIGISGFLSYHFIVFENELIRFLVADLVMTIITFIFSLLKKNSSVYDAYWSVIPFYFIALWWLVSHDTWTIAHYVTAFTVSFWSWRLTHNWYRSWPGWHHEDWRYVNFRKQFGKYFQPINFLAIHLYPTLIVFLSMSALFFLFDGTSKEMNRFILLGNAIAFVGVLFELVADNALYKSRMNPNRVKGTCIRDGIWNYSRNPNYLGEMLFWVGIAMIGFGVGAPVWTGLGALGMILMFVFASIPMKEKRLSESRTDFETYKKEVSRIIPMPARK